MDNIFLKEFNKLGISYPKFGERIGGYDKSTVYSWINNPARLGLTSALFLGATLGISQEDVCAYWKSIKMEKRSDELDKKIAEALAGV